METHDRLTDHFGTQPDTTITTTEQLAQFPAGTTLDVILAYLYGEIESLSDNPKFGLFAFIQPYFLLEAVIQDEQTDDFGLDAWIAYGSTFGLNAVLRTIQSTTFGLDAYIVESA